MKEYQLEDNEYLTDQEILASIEHSISQSQNPDESKSPEAQVEEINQWKTDNLKKEVERLESLDISPIEL